MPDSTLAPLDPALATALLRGHGLVGPDEAIRCAPLGGGVSSIVLHAEGGRKAFVLKQPRQRFAVPDEWRVDDRRVFVEHAFARALAPHLPPDGLAKPVALIPHLRILITEAAPADFAPWKERLLGGNAEPAVAEAAGNLLAAIHAAGERPELAGRFRNPDLFREQRLDPYFHAAAQRAPDLAPSLSRVESLLASRDDLVHGDFSPKNLLTDGRRVMLVDHEVATRADAAFDVAFLLTHLALKALHGAAPPNALRSCAEAFLARYARHRATPDDFSRRVATFWGGLLVARVLGKSPAEYLAPPARSGALALGRRLLQDPASSWGDLPAAWPVQAAASAV